MTHTIRIIVAVLALIALLTAPALGAIIIDERLHAPYQDTSGNGTQSSPNNPAGGTDTMRDLVFKKIENHQELLYIVIDSPKTMGYWAANQSIMPQGRYDLTYVFDGVTKPARVYIARPITGGTKIAIFLNDWNVGTKTGSQRVNLPGWYFIRNKPLTSGSSSQKIRPPIYMYGDACNVNAQIRWVSGIEWYTDVLVTKDVGYEICVNRTVNGQSYQANVTISDTTGLLDSETITGGLTTWWYPSDKQYYLEISAPSGVSYKYTLDGGDIDVPGDSTTLTVYIKNSQTGALIANSNIVIDALVNNEYYPVVNRSEPSGIFSINLQPTGGGPPNPDGYRLIVTADGYNNPMPEINFTVDDYKQSIYCLLDPIAGGPVDENKTFIDFFVSDMYANPIPGATVKFGKYTLITNSAGYTVFEVPKNDYYTYTVSKSGYNTITGNANIGDAPRNTINTYLTTVITTPTQPPTQPPGGIPDEDDDSDGFLVQAVRGIGLAFGVGFSTAKIIFGMLLALSIGFATAKQLRGGAAEFGIGLLGGTILGVLIGLLPVWIIVVLLLVVGLYVGNRYVGGNNLG